MSRSTTAGKLAAILKRDVLIASRYRKGFLIQFLGVLFELAGFYYLAKAIGPGFRPEGIDYYPFLLVGTSLFGFLVVGISAFVAAVHDAQVAGTMEVLLTTSTPPPVMIALSAFSIFVGRTAHLLLFLAAGFGIFRVAVSHVNIPASLLVFLFTVIIAVAVGIAAAAVQIRIQKGQAVVWLVGSAGWLLSGAMFPISVLPLPLQKLAACLPLTYSLNGLRMALLQGASFAAISKPLAVLFIACVVLLPTSILWFTSSVRKARLEGTLSFY